VSIAVEVKFFLKSIAKFSKDVCIYKSISLILSKEFHKVLHHPNAIEEILFE